MNEKIERTLRKEQYRIDDVVAVLNCFYPVKLPFTNQEALRKLRELEDKDNIEDRHAKADELISLYAPHDVRFAYSRINSEGK